MPVEQLVFTDVPRGKGFNPSSSGFQIKACSSGLGIEARERISAICMHYGDIVHRSAPAQALQLENEWRVKGTEISSMPARILQEFPVIWSYTQLNDDHYVLVRVCYTGLSHDGRFGNFFGHALEFPAALLEEQGGNPLALARSGLFLESLSGDETSLPVLPNLKASPSGPEAAFLTRAPYSDPLSALFSALIDSISGRPVLICLPDWRQSAPFVESLLNLFPGKMRCRIPFCTFETDRNWNPNIRSGGGSSRAAYQLLTMCTPDERELNFRADEYSSRFAIYNFVMNKFSDPAAIHPYAAFTIEALLKGKDAERANYNSFLKEFGQEQNPEAWDKLIDVGRAGSISAQESTANAVRVLSSLAVQPSQVQAAMNWLWPRIERMAKNNAAGELGLIRSEAGILIEKLPADQKAGVIDRLANLAEQALPGGWFSTAAALGRLCAKEQNRVTLKLVQKGLQNPVSGQLPHPERQAWLDLLLDGLRLSEANSADAIPTKPLVVEIFKTAQDSGKSAELWHQLGKPVVAPLLEGDWSAEKQNLAQELERCIPARAAPEANAWLNLKLLKNTSKKGEELILLLRQTAAAAAFASDSETVVNELVQISQKAFQDNELSVVALGCIADAVSNQQAGDNLFQLYRENLRQLPGKSHNQVRRKLVSLKAARIVVREFLAETLPWKEEESPRKLQQWRDAVFNSDAQILGELRKQIADFLRTSSQRQDLLPLAEELLPRDGKETSDPGTLALLNTVLLLTPLDPAVRRPWLPARDKGLDGEAAARLHILLFLEEVRQLAQKAQWTPAAFPATNPAWNIDARTLELKERRQVLAWVLDTFRVNGITTADDASGLVDLLDEINEKGSLAEALAALLKGRDPVTCVLVAVAFVECALTGDRARDWGYLLRPVLEKFEKSTRQLLEAHLQNRFGELSSKREERLLKFAEAAGLSLPRTAAAVQSRPEAAPHKGSSAQSQPDKSQSKPPERPETPPADGADTISTPAPQINEMVNRGKQIFKSLFGKSGPAAEPESKDKPESDKKK